MTEEKILTDDTVAIICQQFDPSQDMSLSRAIEQAVLNSPEVQAWKQDAGHFQKMAGHIYGIVRTFDKSGNNRVCRLQINLRNDTPSPKQWLADAVEDFYTGTEQET